MDYKRIYNFMFEELFNGTVILDKGIESKINNKHKVYKQDLGDALGCPYLIALKPKHKSPLPVNKEKSSGSVYEILSETESGKILFIVGRLFSDGNFYIITAYWANKELEEFYRKESEVLRDE